MSPNNNANSQNNNTSEQREGPDRDQRGGTRRASMAIQDLLNPVPPERSETPQWNHPPPRTGTMARTQSVPNHVRLDSSRESQSPPARPRRRHSSAPSGGRPRERRACRPTYSDEEAYFIWYHRIDLGYDWQDIVRAFNTQFPDRPREGLGGMQCKYYRYCDECGVPKVRSRRRAASAAREYGMRSRTGLTFPWMID